MVAVVAMAQNRVIGDGAGLIWHLPADLCRVVVARYMERMAKMDMLLEMELGITGGEEDGVDNTDVKPEDLYATRATHAAISSTPPPRHNPASCYGGEA